MWEDGAGGTWGEGPGVGCGLDAGPEAREPEGILSVRALTERLRRTLETRYPFVWVRGEVSNLSRPASGHVYF
ncbi:MAG: exodeoxyribonuclease VII large subunit, partial [Desulfovibrio sp.]|nr:exodeoxyribonuclease VII large subunit [Desulfovibrio sp.]